MIKEILHQYKRIKNWIRFNLLYIGNPRWDTNQSPIELLEFIETHQPGVSMDLGCGTGKNCLTLWHAGWQVTGVDFAPKAIISAKNRFQKAGAKGTFIISDVSRLEGMDEKYDLVLDMGCYHVLPGESKEDYQKVLKRILKPGGTFLLYGFSHHLFKLDNTNQPLELTKRFNDFMVLEKRDGGLDPGGWEGVWLWFKKPV